MQFKNAMFFLTNKKEKLLLGGRSKVVQMFWREKLSGNKNRFYILKFIRFY